MRISKKERQKNAKQFYNMFMNGCNTKTAIVANRMSSSNPHVSRCQFLVVPTFGWGDAIVIAESNLGVEGCFMELFGFIKPELTQKTYFEEGFDKWMKENFQCRITYKDGFVFMIERG